MLFLFVVPLIPCFSRVGCKLEELLSVFCVQVVDSIMVGAGRNLVFARHNNSGYGPIV